jgi:hypothetical protein
VTAMAFAPAQMLPGAAPTRKPPVPKPYQLERS